MEHLSAEEQEVEELRRKVEIYRGFVRNTPKAHEINLSEIHRLEGRFFKPKTLISLLLSVALLCYGVAIVANEDSIAWQFFGGFSIGLGLTRAIRSHIELFKYQWLAYLLAQVGVGRITVNSAIEKGLEDLVFELSEKEKLLAKQQGS